MDSISYIHRKKEKHFKCSFLKALTKSLKPTFLNLEQEFGLIKGWIQVLIGSTKSWSEDYQIYI